MSQPPPSPRRSSYGGQAVIEGVMMRGTRAYCIAVRSPDQSIRVEAWPLRPLYRGRWNRIPLVRGLFVLAAALDLGFRSLAFSANAQAQQDSERIEGASLTLTMIGSLVLGTAGFLLLPAGAAHLLQGLVGLSGVATNLLEGGLRLGLLIGYIWSIGRVPEIRRVFGYHAAEHMTIHAFEANESLTVPVVSRYPKEHPRCGTAFLLTVVLLSVVLFTVLGPMPLGARLVTRLLALPLLGSLSYEYVRLTANLADRRLGRVLMAPNLLLQKLTTRPASAEMVEVAIRSFEGLQVRERELEPGPFQTAIQGPKAGQADS